MADESDDPIASVFVDAEDAPPIDDVFTQTDGDTDTDDAREKKPSQRKHTGPRKSAAQLITLAWGGAGTMLVRTGTDIPVGRVLQFQAPLAGTKIDELIRDTWFDAFLQPLVASAEKVEGLGAIIMFPLLIGAYERNPAIGEMIEPILREVVEQTLVEMAPVIRSKNAKAKRAAQAMPEIREMLNVDKDTNPVDAVLASIFQPPPEATTDAAE